MVTSFTHLKSPVRILGISQAGHRHEQGVGAQPGCTRALRTKWHLRVWIFSIQITPAWLENLTLQAGECPGVAETHCRL